MARYDDEEEKWGTAEGIITGEAPRRGSIIKPPVGSLREAGEKARQQMGRGPRPAVIPEWEWGKQAARDVGEFLITPPRIRRERAALSPTVTQDLSREVADRVLGRTEDYATRVEGRIQPQREPIVPTSTLESVWGIGRETLPTGATRYTIPGEGIMTAAPETAATRLGDEAARRGVVGRIGAETAEREHGAETELSNIERLREEGIQRQRYEEGTVERQRREDLGLEPKLGYAAYEEAGKRMREGVIPPKERAAIEVARIGAVSESEKARLTAEGVISATGMKAQTEAAKLGIQAAGIKSTIELNKAKMDDMLTKTGLLEPMKLKLQGARDAVERRKIQRDAYEKASLQIYQGGQEALKNQLNLGQIDPAKYDTEFKLLSQAYAARQDIISDANPIEGQTHSSGAMILRNGIWVDIPGKGKKE